MSNVRSIEKKVDEVNRLISLAVRNDKPIPVYDRSGTWQSPMKYKPIKYSNGTMYVEYEELDLYKHNRSKGQINEWVTVKDKILKGNMEYENPLNNIAKMYRSALREYNIPYEDGGNLLNMETETTKSSGEKYRVAYYDNENRQTKDFDNFEEADEWAKENHSKWSNIYRTKGTFSTTHIEATYRDGQVKKYEDGGGVGEYDKYVENIYSRQSEQPVREQLISFSRENGFDFSDEIMDGDYDTTEDAWGGTVYSKEAIRKMIGIITGKYANGGGVDFNLKSGQIWESPNTEFIIGVIDDGDVHVYSNKLLYVYDMEGAKELLLKNDAKLISENNDVPKKYFSFHSTSKMKDGGQMFNEHWTQKEVNELISKAKKHKKEYEKDYLVLSNDNGKSIETRSKADFMQYPQNYRDAHTIIFDTTELTETVKNTNEMKDTQKMDDGGLINTNEMTVDKGQPLSDPTIQNADIGSQSYVPKSLVCETVDTVAPVSMLYQMNRSLTEIDREVRGIDDFVRVKLGYKDMMAMCRAFSAEQVDAIANAIYQIEKGQALIVGDMTGVGKGRIAAGIIRYAKLIGKTPIFFTEKPNLFSDIYRDIIAIGSDDGIPLYYAGKEIEKIKQVTRKVIVDRIMEDIDDGDFELEYNEEKLFKKGYEKETKQCIEEYRDLYFPSDVIKEVQYIRNDDYKKQTRNAVQLIPFIVNGRSAKTEIKDENGHIVYEGISNAKPEMKLKKAFEDRKLPKGYDVVLLTYSQVNSPTRAIEKIQWLNSVGNDSIVVMDESHNASGSSQTGAFLQEFIQKTAGVCFLSATFAKRPDNMPIYAMKTAIQDAELDNDKLISAILAGGVALQEILSGELVSEGQMLRRERSYEGVVVNYNYLDERMLDRDVPLPNFNLKEAHEAVSDKVTALVRRMMEFQKEHVNPIIEQLDDDLKAEQAGAGQEEGVKEAGINNTPVFSGIFNLINQLLLSIKADAVADFAITRMKEGKKCIIGFSNTLESFLDYLIQGDKDEKIRTDFSIILRRRLEKILTYTKTNAEGEREKKALNPDDYPIMGAEYESILKEIERASTGITISPIDRILNRIKEAGFTVGEVTGRKKYVEFLPDGKHGLVKSRRVETANDLFRRFNDNDIDCLLINQSGATGASAQDIKSKKAYIVNYNKDGSVIIPKSLEPKNEVKQRVMIILQAELDINKEVQKRGRINRTGQVFKPIYDYVISAIPAEERLMMMLQKKLKSLDANTTSNQKNSKKLLDVVDFLNVYGDEKVVEFLKSNSQYNDLTGNILKFELGQPTETTKQITDKAHKVSGRVAILPVEMQSNFYKTVSETYQNLEMQLKASGEWNLEVENMDLDAETVDKSAVMVGNPAKSSVFSEAVFMEKCRVNNLRKPYKQSEVVNLVSQSLTLTDKSGRVKTFTADEKKGFLLQKLYDHMENNEKNAVENYNERMKEDIEAIKDMPSLEKMKKDERKTIIEEKTKKITEDYEARIESIKSQYTHLRRMIEGHLKYFYPKRLLEYPLANYEVNGNTVKCICLGIDVNFNVSNPFAPSGMTLKIVLPNGMRMLKFPLSDSFVSLIRIATEANHDTKSSSESDSDYFIESWDTLTKESQANRVTKFIITGNILKGYGNPDYRIGGKLISYTTKDGLIKKGILLPDDFKVTDIRVQVPINKMLKYVLGMRDGGVLPLYGMDVTLQSRGEFVYLMLKPKNNPYISIKDDSDINGIAWETEFVKKSGEWQNKFESKIIKNLLNILWEKYKMTASVTQTVFESIKDEFDLTERKHETIDGTEELIKKHNAALEEYERSKKFEVIDEKSLKKLSDLEKENYEFKKRIAELEGFRRLYKVSRIMNDDIRKRKREAEDAAKSTAQMEQGGTTTMENGGTIDSERRFTDSDYNKLIATEKFKGTWSGYVWEIYESEGGKVLGKFNPHKNILFIAGKKDKTNPLVEWLQTNSYVSSDEYTKLIDGGYLDSEKHSGIIKKIEQLLLNESEKIKSVKYEDLDVFDIILKEDVSDEEYDSLRTKLRNMNTLKIDDVALHHFLDEGGLGFMVKVDTEGIENSIQDYKSINNIGDILDSETQFEFNKDLTFLFTYDASLLNKKDEHDKSPIDYLGGAYVEYDEKTKNALITKGTIKTIYVFEGDSIDRSKPVYQIYPKNEYSK